MSIVHAPSSEVVIAVATAWVPGYSLVESTCIKIVSGSEDVCTDKVSVLRHLISKMGTVASAPDDKWGDLVATGALCLTELNSHLESRTFMHGHSLSSDDLIVAAGVYTALSQMSAPDRVKHMHLCRWFNFIQSTAGLKSSLTPELKFNINVKHLTNESDTAAKGKGKVKAKKEKSKKPSVSKVDTKCLELDIRVGRVVSVVAHPTFEGLYVEQIDIGDVEAQVVSGLAKYLTIEEMTDRLVAVVTNLPGASIHGVDSSGLVLCASTSDKSTVEPLQVPSGATTGERVAFGTIATPAESPKPLTDKKFHKLKKSLAVNGDGVAVFGDYVLSSSTGPLTVPTLRGANVA